MTRFSVDQRRFCPALAAPYQSRGMIHDAFGTYPAPAWMADVRLRKDGVPDGRNKARADRYCQFMADENSRRDAEWRAEADFIIESIKGATGVVGADA